MDTQEISYPQENLQLQFLCDQENTSQYIEPSKIDEYNNSLNNYVNKINNMQNLIKFEIIK